VAGRLLQICVEVAFAAVTRLLDGGLRLRPPPARRKSRGGRFAR
jgi:hypothetical protein